MKYEFPDGVWPVMLTPYTEKNTVDYHALEKLVEWYAGQGADGLFAVCQSSEMFFLSLEERARIAAFVKKISPIPVIVSRHIGESFRKKFPWAFMNAPTLIKGCCPKK